MPKLQFCETFVLLRGSGFPPVVFNGASVYECQFKQENINTFRDCEYL